MNALLGKLLAADPAFGYARALRDAFAIQGAPPILQNAPSRASGIPALEEPLSERELDVLRLLASTMAGSEIADRPVRRYQHRPVAHQSDLRQTRRPHPPGGSRSGPGTWTGVGVCLAAFAAEQNSLGESPRLGMTDPAPHAYSDGMGSSVFSFASHAAPHAFPDPWVAWSLSPSPPGGRARAGRAARSRMRAIAP